MKTVISLLLLSLLGGGHASANWPELRGRDTHRQKQLHPRLDQIRTEHPRIFCSVNELEEIRQRATSVPEVQEVYNWLLYWAKSDRINENLWMTGDQLIAACVAYRLDGDKTILAHALKIADYLAKAEGDNWTWPRISKGLAFAYDWLYEDLTETQRQAYGIAALHAARECYNSWRHSDFSNRPALEYGPILYTGIALWQEGLDDHAATQLILDGLQLLVDHLMPAHEIVTQGFGGWHESMSYHGFFIFEFALLIQLWSNASGENLWQDYTGLDGDAAWLVHCARPFDEQRVGIGDMGWRNSFNHDAIQSLTLLQRYRQDGLARTWTDRIKEEAIRLHTQGIRYLREGHRWWPYVLWYDPSIPVVPRESLDPARLFSGIGWAAMRSDWTSNATFAVFVCSPLWLSGHQHCDNNSFVIHRGGLLALDSGVYEGTEHRANYYARSIAHNTVTVFDPSERFNGDVWGNDSPEEGSNDGGQLFTPAPEWVSDLEPGHPYHRGQILAYQSNDAFVYVVGDATSSYDAKKMREFTRGFLFIRPDLFVVFDRVEATKSEFRKTWLLHTAQEPSIDATKTTVSNAKAELYVWTIWPKDASIRKIGGLNKEFLVNGINYPPETSINVYDKDEAGRWRLEVSPHDQQERQYFLHVLIAHNRRSRGSSTKDLTISLHQDEEHLGVNLVGEDSNINVSFTKRGSLLGTLSIETDTAALTSWELN